MQKITMDIELNNNSQLEIKQNSDGIGTWGCPLLCNTCFCSLQLFWILTPTSESPSSPKLWNYRSFICLVNHLGAKGVQELHLPDDLYCFLLVKLQNRLRVRFKAGVSAIRPICFWQPVVFVLDWNIIFKQVIFWPNSQVIKTAASVLLLANWIPRLHA